MDYILMTLSKSIMKSKRSLDKIYFKGIEGAPLKKRKVYINLQLVKIINYNRLIKLKRSSDKVYYKGIEKPPLNKRIPYINPLEFIVRDARDPLNIFK
jgi:hypothetical protein